ncbi:protein BREVIS RADIX [Euphorbia lathyris]|uniref:protein BREVIS RADIX n=1 Tax=Euphorbia lathyris TaxID=212925 RepID=UPI003313E64F
MFTCIACTKPVAEEGEEGARGSGTPSTKEAVKSLTAQIKDMALKLSGKQCKPCPGGSGSSSGYRKGESGYPDFDVNSPYFGGGGSSSSTPAWDFHRGGGGGGRGDSRFSRVLGGAGSAGADVVVDDDDQNKEWMAQVEPGVHITFVSLPNGGNDLKRIRFSRDMFNKWQAQRWWGENYDRIMELYNVQRFNRQSLNTPPRSEAEPDHDHDPERDSSYSRRESPMIPSYTPRNYYNNSNMEASRTTTSSRDEGPSISVSNASDMESEWVEQDEPGVYITIRQLPDGTRELRRVRFSRERFGEVNAKNWWEENRERIQSQYL